MSWEWVLAIAGGIAVAAACGLRAFLPLLALGIAGRLGWMDLHAGAEWLARDAALACFGLAAVLELAADKIPVVDHALDAVGAVLRPLAGVVAAWAMLPDGPAPWPQIGALVLGGGAFAMQALKANVRLGTTATTLGHGNPIVSTVEDLLTAILVLVGIVLPFIALGIVVVVVVGLARKRRASLRTTEPSLSSRA